MRRRAGALNDPPLPRWTSIDAGDALERGAAFHVIALVLRPPLVHERSLHFLRDGAVLLDAPALEGDHTAIRLARLFLLDHSGVQADRIAVLYGLQHAPVVNAQQCEHRTVVDAARILEPTHDRVDQW